MNIEFYIIYIKENLMKMTMCILVGFFLISLAGCRTEKKIEKIADIEYDICEDNRLPKELLEIIDAKKQEPFKMTYGNKTSLYIIIGYGKQDRSNLCVTVDELYLTENAIYVDTTLVSNNEEDKGIVTYPYIVMKCETYNLPVVFK